MPSRLFALCNLLGSPSLNRFVRLIIWVAHCVFNASSRKSYCLILRGFIFTPFTTAHSTRVSRSFCKFSISFLFVIFLYIINSSAKILIFESTFLQISLTYTRNSSGLKTLPCGTPEFILTSLDRCRPTVTFCVRPTSNSLTQTTTLVSTPEIASFVSSRSWGTKSKALEKSIIIACIPTSSYKSPLCLGTLWWLDFHKSTSV